ncbi:hypothetical protein VQ056_24295 [Paenibacillus sp. JTLBN-2024]
MKSDGKLLKEIDEFDDAFPDGVFCIPRIPGEPRVKVRALMDYFDKKGIEPNELSPVEMDQFLQY